MDMEFKGTKGKWMVSRVFLVGKGDTLTVCPKEPVKYKTGYRAIADISPYNLVDDEDLANAQLISKAPEMLGMLKLILKEFEVKTLEQGFIKEDLKQLIKEATTI